MEKDNNRISEDIRNIIIKLGYEILGRGATFSDVLKAGVEEVENLISLDILKRELVNGKVSNVSYELDSFVDRYYPILSAKVDDKSNIGYRFGKLDDEGNEGNEFAFRPYVKATYLFQQSNQPKKVIDILRKQNSISYRIWVGVICHKRTNKSECYSDKEWLVETLSMAKAIEMASGHYAVGLDIDDKGNLIYQYIQQMEDEIDVYFGHQFDKRGRIYNDGYLLNYQGDEWSKAALLPNIKEQKLTNDGKRAMLIDLSNHLGNDKLTYDERLDKVKDLDSIDLSKAKKPILATRSYAHLKEALANNTTNYVASIDATASGMQILSIIANCEETAKVTNLTDNSQCYDIYGIACEKIIAKTGIENVSVKDIRDIVKKALMTRGYNSDKQVEVAQTELKRFKIIIGLSELKAILDCSDKITKAKDAMNNLLCDTFSNLEDDKQIIRYTMPDGFIVEIANIKKAMENCNCRYFKLNIMYDKLGWNKELNWRALSPNLVHSVDAYICRELIRRCPFEIVTIHDCFSCHPNHIDELRLQYIKLLKELQDINILDYIGKQLNPNFSWKYEGDKFEILESKDSYCLC